MAIIGAILGDIAGSPFEFQFDSMHMDIRKKGEYELFMDDPVITGVCEATDDTLMTVACMEACETDLDFAKHYREIGVAHINGDFGTHFRMWLMNPDMKAYNSYGNGSAMRCSYCADAFFKPGDYSKAEEMARLSSLPTHSHPEGIKGAVVLTHCLCMIKDGKSKEEIEQYAISEYAVKKGYIYGVDRPFSDYKDTMGYEVSCQGSVPVAIRCFLDSSSFEECCKMIISMPCDTDTVCAIAGPLCEEYYGYCMSKEKDEELVKKYVPEDILEKLEKYGIIEKDKAKDIEN